MELGAGRKWCIFDTPKILPLSLISTDYSREQMCHKGTSDPVIRLGREVVFLSRWQQNENRCHILHCPWAVSAAGRTCDVDRCLLLDPAVLCEDLIPTMEVTSDRSAACRRIRKTVGSCSGWSYPSQAAHVTCGLT